MSLENISPILVRHDILTTLILCSFRYAIDRDTGVNIEISKIISYYKDEIGDWAKAQIIRDIKRKINVIGFKYAEDLIAWKRVLKELES